jgi:ABC-type sugar transport system ATPase subunit
MFSPPGEAAAASAAPPVLRISGVAKTFPGAVALRGATLDLTPGEVHALVGENGAGKSTLIRILTGAISADAGTVELDGQRRCWDSPLAAQAAGIAAIYQELDLVPALSLRANLFLGRERARLGFVSAREERARARAALAGLAADLDPDGCTRDLALADQQLVAIARALLASARVVVMDEPTATLASAEVARLFAAVCDLRARGVAILFVSHRLDEVFALADRVTVLRDGATVATWPVAGLTRDQLVEAMVGRPLADEFPTRRIERGRPMLAVQGLEARGVHGVSFTVHAGEVLGLAGLVGAGRSALARALFGADVRIAGELLLDGERIDITSPSAAIRHGIGLLTEDRKRDGLVLGLSARENFALANLDLWSAWGVVRRDREAAAFTRYVERLRIRLSGPEQPARQLSGGNQQKLLLARWLARGARVLIFDEPTRGVDVAARHELYLLVNELAAQGKAIVLVSSELPEILGMSDRILVMRAGRIAGEIADVAVATQQHVLRLAVG